MSSFKVKVTTIHFWLTVLILALFFFTPIYRAQKIMIIYPLIFCWILVSNCLDRGWFSRSLWVFGLLGCFVVLDFIRYMTTSDVSILQSLVGHKLLLYMWPIFLVYYADRVENFKKIFMIFLLMVSVSTFFTTIGNIKYPEASRLLASFGASYNQDTRIMYKEMFIGGYGLIFALAFLVMPMLMYAKKSKKRWVYLLTGFFVIAVVFGAYTIAVGIVAISVVLRFVKSRRVGGMLIGCVVLFMLVGMFKNQILMAIMNVGDAIGSQMLTKRARQILYGTYAADQGNMSRPLLYMNAFRNILDHPIFGLLTGAVKERASGHSMLLEYFEVNGIFGVTYVALFVKTFRFLCEKLFDSEIRVTFLAWSALIAVFLAVDQFSAAYEAGGGVPLHRTNGILAFAEPKTVKSEEICFLQLMLEEVNDRC